MMTVNPKPQSISLPCLISGNIKLPSTQEFEMLLRFEDKIEPRDATSQGEGVYTTDKPNVHDVILPFEQNRVKLKNAIGGCDYINASRITILPEEGHNNEFVPTPYVPLQKMEIIVGNDPTESTRVTYYHMLHERKIHIVVSLEIGKSLKQLKIGKCNNYGHMKVTALNRTLVHDYLFRSEVSLVNTSSPITTSCIFNILPGLQIKYFLRRNS